MSAVRRTPEVYVDSVGFVAPGLEGWNSAQAVLRGEVDYARAELSDYAPRLLPPNERRRATPAVRLAFRAAEQVVAEVEPRNTVFASSDADTTVVHRLCSALAQPARQVSPTDFHNSVHNAASGYWSIAKATRGASTSLSAWDETFAAGLSEAIGLVLDEGGSTLLVAYDIVPPDPLRVRRGIEVPAGVALMLSATRSVHSSATLCVSPTPKVGEAPAQTPMGTAALERLRLANPALRALPLLQRLARCVAGSVAIPAAGYGLLHLKVDML